MRERIPNRRDDEVEHMSECRHEYEGIDEENTVRVRQAVNRAVLNIWESDTSLTPLELILGCLQQVVAMTWAIECHECRRRAAETARRAIPLLLEMAAERVDDRPGQPGRVQ